MTHAFTPDEYRALTGARAAKKNKFNAKRVPKGLRADGIGFDSTSEAKRYDILRLRELAGEIVPGSIERQVRFPLVVNGVHVAFYVADFVYVTSSDFARHVEDVKGLRLDVYRIKRALMKACHGVEIEEIGEARKPKRKPNRTRKT
jgi:hypothetical protein